MGSGRWVEQTAVVAERRTKLTFVAVVSIIVGSLLFFLSGAAAPFSILLLVGLMVLARKFFDLQIDIAGMKRRGADAEAAVGAVLDALISEGYYVLHDLEHVVPGNVDHLISGPTGTFLVETKSNGFPRRALGRTKSAACVVSRELCVRYVVPVICLHSRRDAQWRQEKVEVVGIDRLAAFIRAGDGESASIERLTALAARG